MSRLAEAKGGRAQGDEQLLRRRRDRTELTRCKTQQHRHPYLGQQKLSAAAQSLELLLSLGKFRLPRTQLLLQLLLPSVLLLLLGRRRGGLRQISRQISASRATDCITEFLSSKYFQSYTV